MDGPVFVFFTGIETELLEKNGAQLRSRVHVELLAGVGVNALHQHLALLREVRPQSLEELAVDPDPGHLHLCQHAHQRELEPLIEVGQLACHQRFLECGRELQDDNCAPTRPFGLHVTVEVEGSRLGIGRLDLQREESQCEVVEQVLPFGGIEQIGHDRGVVAQCPHVDREPVHQFLGPVSNERRTVGSNQRGKRLVDARVGQERSIDRDRVTVCRTENERTEGADDRAALPSCFEPVGVARFGNRVECGDRYRPRRERRQPRLRAWRTPCRRRPHRWLPGAAAAGCGTRVGRTRPAPLRDPRRPSEDRRARPRAALSSSSRDI